MPALTTIIAIAGVAAAIGGTVAQKQAATKQRKQAKKQAEDAKAAAQAKKPSKDTGANVALRRNDVDARRGRGSRASRRRQALNADGGGVLGLQAPSASAVGGL